MTQLLISIKNVAEAMMALEAGVGIIDLKNPSFGALGALSVHETMQIIQAIKERKTIDLNASKLTRISTTVGEQHIDLNHLISDIRVRGALGVDLVKVAVCELFYAENFFNQMQLLTRSGIKLIAVFFADEPMDLTLLFTLKKIGFFGAMLDTQSKQQNLLQVQTKSNLQIFTQKCHDNDLQSGLAGSLQPQHIEDLIQFNSTYIGFRGGVCENFARESNLSCTKVIEIKKLLHSHNKINAKPQERKHLALHS